MTPHDGKTCPVPDGTKVRVRFRNGNYQSFVTGSIIVNLDAGTVLSARAGGTPKLNLWRWAERSHTPYDIVAYQIDTPRGMGVLREALKVKEAA